MIRHIDTPIKVEEGNLTVQRVPLLVLLLISSQSLVVGAIGNFSPQQITAEERERCGFEAFSRNIQVAFERSMDEHQSSRSWLISTPYCKNLPESVLSNYHSLGLVNAALVPDISGIWQFDFMQEIVFPAPLDEGVQAWYPLSEWTRESRYTPNDPRFSDQWHLENFGQSGSSGEDANITGAWDIADGTGVLISVVDDGVETDHPDLSPNYKTSLDYDYCGNDNNPNPSNNDAHGTKSAGVAAAIGDNGIGGTGAAMNADLIGIRLIACSLSDTREANALGHSRSEIDISSNSWGPSDDGQTLEGPGPLLLNSLEKNVYEGRDGKGIIITLAGGNGRSDDDNSNYDGYANSRFTIAVAAVTDWGGQSWYSEDGANILIAAPSNGGESGITTTDLNGGYTNSFGGTSSATPLVSGVVALMLDENPDLTWRDVQHILVNSARKNDAGDSDWSINGAGHDINHKYGFGVVDAGLAVHLSTDWDNVDQEVNWSSGQMIVNQQIPDDSNAWTSKTIQVNESISIESVEVVFDADHDYRGDLEVKLTSPSGTESVLAESHGDGGNDYNQWIFTSMRHWDEDSEGEWTLSVRDTDSPDAGTWNSWELMMHGTELIKDADGDGLLDNEEGEDGYGTDPYNNDTDGDGLLDGYEIFNTSTNPLSNDSDLDLLDDFVEINLHGTNPMNNDTDGDLITDWDEIYVTFSNPLVFDKDEDMDSWYWFSDCNDTNPNIYPNQTELLNGIDENCNDLIDEGFESMDTDNDGINDYNEYHTWNTNHLDEDTDMDGLNDGDEAYLYLTNPLVFDNDSDGDGFYWFQDCNDSEERISPDASEQLDGVDNNCNEIIDEGFADLDSDNDGLSDYEEYYVYKTNHLDDDSDKDTLLDGKEVYVFKSNPLVANFDNDTDTYFDFEDCNDSNPDVYPEREEIWNQIDDDCDMMIDENLTEPLPDPPYILSTSTPIDAKINTNGTLSVNFSGEETQVRWIIDNITYLGTNLSINFDEVKIWSWVVCVENRGGSACTQGQINVLDDCVSCPQSNQDDLRGQDATSLDYVGWALVFTSFIVIVILLFMLLGKKGGGSLPTQYSMQQGIPPNQVMSPMNPMREQW